MRGCISVPETDLLVKMVKVPLRFFFNAASIITTINIAQIKIFSYQLNKIRINNKNTKYD